MVRALKIYFCSNFWVFNKLLSHTVHDIPETYLITEILYYTPLIHVFKFLSPFNNQTLTTSILSVSMSGVLLVSIYKWNPTVFVFLLSDICLP